MEDLTGQKIIVISDLHLTKEFSQEKYSLVNQAIDSADKLIINGDLWEGFGMNFQDFINSSWQQLFPLFKQKKTVYIFGNHDPNEHNETAYKQFCDRVVANYHFQQNKTLFYVTHGDLFDPTLDLRHPNLPRFILNWGSQFERLFVRLFGRRYLDIYKHSNQKMKTWHEENLTDDWLICGHSHLPEVDIKNKYANSGIFLSKGLASYLQIQAGKVELKYL